jgi:hypothetical protein
MHKRQRRRELEGVMASHLIMDKLQVPISRGESFITSPAARGAASAINNTFEAEEGKLQALLSYEATVQHSHHAMGMCSSTKL